MTHFPVSNHYGRKTVAFDMDGTLTQPTGSEVLGHANVPMVNLVRRLIGRGWQVVVHSARPASHNPTVRAWLADRLGPTDMAHVEVACGTKPAADVFVDDKGLMLPIDALEEVIEMSVREPHQMWTETDLSLRPFTAEWLEVHDNPDWHGVEIDDRYRCVVPFSGGLDSLTCLAMAERAGLDPWPVYVDTGAPYSKHERSIIHHLAIRVGARTPDIVTVGVTYQTLAGYIDLGRNAVYLWELAQYAQRKGGWGEVWFGNVGDWQETPVRGGDKSLRFFTTMQHVLSGTGQDVRVVNPLIGMTKVDLVSWWAQRDLVDLAAQSFSCYSTGPEHCGRCRACFKRWVTFGAAGFADLLRWPAGLVARPHAEAFWRAWRTDRSPSMAPGRYERVATFLRDVGMGPEMADDEVTVD